MYKLGNEILLTLFKTGFLCSRRIPDNQHMIISEWVKQLSPDNDCILCGNHSKAEQEVFTLLLQLKIPTILVLAESMKTHWSDEIQRALKENRILIITTCEETIHQVNWQTAADRNNLILSLAETIVIGYCSKGGNIERQISNLKNVTILSSKSIYKLTKSEDSSLVMHNIGSIRSRLKKLGKLS